EMSHSLRVGRAWPRARARARTIAPATTNRVPAIKSGGNVSTAIRIPRKVEPQRIHRATKAKRTRGCAVGKDVEEGKVAGEALMGRQLEAARATGTDSHLA